MNQPFQHPLLASLSGADLQSIAERAVSDPRWRSSERLLRKIGREDLISEVVVGILEGTRHGRWASNVPVRAIAWKAACWKVNNIIAVALQSSRADRYASGHVSFLRTDFGEEIDVFEKIADDRPNPEIEFLYRESCLNEDGEELPFLAPTNREASQLASRRFEATKLHSLRTKVARAGNKALGPSLIAFPVAVQTERLLVALTNEEARSQERKVRTLATKERRREKFKAYILRLCPWVREEVAGLSENQAGNIISIWADRVRAISPDGSLTAFGQRTRPFFRDETTGELLVERPRLPKPPKAPALRAPRPNRQRAVRAPRPPREPRPPKPSKEPRPPKPPREPFVRAPGLSPEEVRRRGRLASTWVKFRKKQAARYGLQAEVARLENLPAEERIAEIRRLIEAKGGFQRGGKAQVFESTEHRVKVLSRWASFKAHWAKAYGLQHLVPELQDLPTLERDARVRAVMENITARGIRLKMGPRSPIQKSSTTEVNQ